MTRNLRPDQRSKSVPERLERYCRETYPEYFQGGGFAEMSLHHVAGMNPHELWRADFAPTGRTDGGGEDTSIYLVTNGHEVVDYDDAERAIADLLAEQQELRVRERMGFAASPLAVSGVLAVGMLALIGYLSVFTDKQIPQLWTVFTAVIAFYFGKHGGTALEKRPAAEP